MEIIEIYKEYYSYIYNYSLKLTCHPDDALDLTQETFLKVIEKIDTLEDKIALPKWLRTICFHIFIDKARKDKNKYIQEIDDWDELEREGMLVSSKIIEPEEEVIVEEEIRSLQNGCFLAMVRKLTLNQRIVFSLVDMYGLKVEYVATLLNISTGAAKGLLHRARMNIDSFFADHCNIIYEKNPCSCKAWIDFSSNRSNLQKEAKRIVNKLDFKEKGYVYNEEVRKKIFCLYKTMPEQKPPKEWYEKVFAIINS